MNRLDSLGDFSCYGMNHHLVCVFNGFQPPEAFLSCLPVAF